MLIGCGGSNDSSTAEPSSSTPPTTVTPTPDTTAPTITLNGESSISLFVDQEYVEAWCKCY